MRKKILHFSVAVSLCVHLLFLLFLQTHSLWFYSPKEVGVSGQMEKVPHDQILKESFQPSFAKGAERSPQQELFLQNFSQPSFSVQHPPIQFRSLMPLDQLMTQTLSFSFPLPPVQSIDLSAHLPKELIIPPHKKEARQAAVPTVEMVVTALAPEIVSSAPLPEVASQQKPAIAAESEKVAVAVAPTIPLPTLPQLPTLAELETVNLSDSFESEITFVPTEKGYVFTITLIPRSDLKLGKMKQNVTFLIDRSNSIQQQRLQTAKSAVLRAAEELGAEDTFNIIAFDTKTEKLFPNFSAPTEANLKKASKFLDNIALGSLFSYGDLYKSLFLTIPMRVQDDELYSTILLTDGASLSKKHNETALLRDWTLQNMGRVSLYTVSMNDDPNFETLEAACTFNKGKLFSSTTNRGFKRQLLKLVKSIRSPVAKGVVARVISKNARGNVEVFPSAFLTPHIYIDQPYVVFGTTETLDDFILFVQARLKDGWVHIKKNVSFANAKKGVPSLQKQVAIQKAYRHYEYFLADGNPQHLADVRALIEPNELKAIQ